MNYIIVANKKPIAIGRYGEDGVTTVQFSINAFFPHLANATFGLVHQRSGDVAPYPCTVTVLNGYVDWLIGSGDLAKIGNGTAQLSAYVDGAIAKTEIFTTVVLDSMGMVDPPEPTQAWVDRVIQAGNSASDSATRAQGYAQDAAASAQDAQDILDGIQSSVDTALETAKQSGEFDGEDGYSPVITVADITGGHTVTITDADHPSGQTFTVLDGEKGDPGEGVPAGGNTNYFLCKKSTTDYDTKWVAPPNDEVGWVSYGSPTTSVDIELAYATYDIVLCKTGGRTYMLTERTSSSNHKFTCVVAGVVYSLTCAHNTWSSSSTKISAPATASPEPIGTAAVGTSEKYAKADHVHDYAEDFTTALLALVENVVYSGGDGSTYIAALESALLHSADD